MWVADARMGLAVVTIMMICFAYLAILLVLVC